MKNSNIDEAIKDYLMQETDVAETQKEAIWVNIEQRLFRKPKSNRKNKWIVLAVAAAIIMVTWAGFGTSSGKALLQNIKDMFIQEKDVDIEIEGHKESTKVELEANEALSYVIYVDTSRYHMEQGEISDIISPDPPLEERYPNVSMEITLEKGTSDEKMEDIKQHLEAEGFDIRQDEHVDEPIKARVVRAIGEETDEIWDTPVYKYYVTESEAGQYFKIVQQYFLEAAEGHGARMDAMLESFEIVNEGN